MRERVYKNKVVLYGTLKDQKSVLPSGDKVYNFVFVSGKGETLGTVDLSVPQPLVGTAEGKKGVLRIDGQLRSHKTDGIYVMAYDLEFIGADAIPKAMEQTGQAFVSPVVLDIVSVTKSFGSHTSPLGVKSSLYRVRFRHPVFDKVYYINISILSQTAKLFDEVIARNLISNDRPITVFGQLSSRIDKRGQKHMTIMVQYFEFDGVRSDAE